MALLEKLKKKETTAADLPEEVVRKEILTRLPIKSVVCFKFVSKSWLSLFCDPQFVKEHHTAAQNSNDYDCLIAQKNTRIFILSRYKETFLLRSDNYFLIGSINGLVCISNGKKFSLWNPAIHQSKEFTLPAHRSSSCSHNSNTGLGFDPVSNDYKVVVLSNDGRSASVYSSNSDTWIDINVREHVFPEIGVYQSTSQITIVKGCPYWKFGRYTYGENHGEWQCTSVSLVVVKFDVGNNEFKLLPEFHPDLSACENLDEIGYKFVDMKDRFTLMVYDRNTTNCMVDMYYLDGEEGCCVWSKMYSLGPLDFQTQNSYFSLSQGFKYGGEIVFSEDGMFSCYNHKTHTIKRLLGTTSNISSIRCFTYTPSLVFLEGMKSVYLTTQTRRTPGVCYRTPRRLINSLRDSSVA